MDVQMEREFCSNFKCCDVKLSDLHALFDHLGTCHQNSGKCALPYAVPSAGPSPTSHSPTYTALSEFLQPMWPSPPRPSLHLQRTKTLFTRDPIPLVSPTASESSSTSSSTPLSAWHSKPRSIHTRDHLYTPVSIPPTLRMDRPQDGTVSWSISSPASYYGYYPSPTPFAPIFYSPTPLRPNAQPIPSHVEAIDVDRVSSPPPRVTAFLGESVAPPAPAPPPAPIPLSALPLPVLEAEPAAESKRPRPAADDEPPAKRHCGPTSSPSTPTTSAFIASLRRRFQPPPSLRGRAADTPLVPDLAQPTETIDAAEAVSRCSTAADIAIEVGPNADVIVSKEGVIVSQGEALGGGEVVVDIVNETEVVPSNNDPAEPAMTPDVGAQVVSEQAGSDDIRDDSVPVSPASGKPAVYMDGRRKKFACPVPGCIKAYMTVNGLKYHEQRGTCITADGTSCIVPVGVERVLLPATTATVSPAATTSAPPPKTTKTTTRKPLRRRSTPTRHSTRLASSANPKGATLPSAAPRSRSVLTALSSDASDSESGDFD